MKKWVAKDQDNNLIDETMVNWDKIKHSVKELWFDNNGQIISLPSDMSKYIQGKTASAIIGGNAITIESRFIGFVKDNIEFKIRVDEKNNKITTEINRINT